MSYSSSAPQTGPTRKQQASSNLMHTWILLTKLAFVLVAMSHVPLWLTLILGEGGWRISWQLVTSGSFSVLSIITLGWIATAVFFVCQRQKATLGERFGTMFMVTAFLVVSLLADGHSWSIYWRCMVAADILWVIMINALLAPGHVEWTVADPEDPVMICTVCGLGPTRVMLLATSCRHAAHPHCLKTLYVQCEECQ